MSHHDDHNLDAAAEVDDITAYIAALDEQERSEIAAAGTALDVAILLARGAYANAATILASIQQGEPGQIDRIAGRLRTDTIGVYLKALGYGLAEQETNDAMIDQRSG